MSDPPAPRARASSSGARRFSPIRLAPSWPRRPRTARPSCWVRSTSGASRKSDAAGRFCATAGSTLTRGSAAASSTTTRSASPSRSRRRPGRPWLPHASRVGTASRHVARVAAQRQRLAGQIRSDSVGVWRDRAGAGPGRNRPHSRELRRARAAGAARAGARGCGSDSRRVFSFPHQPRLDSRFRSPIRAPYHPAAGTCDRAVPLQRLGQVSRLEKGRPDPRARRRAAQATAVPRDVVLEGGSIDVNGKGTLLTTEECLLDPAVQVRNPGLGRAEIEAVLRDQLDVTNVLWLGKGIAGDDTHGHVDDLCRFVNPRTVALCRETDPHDANYRALEENRERLQGMRLEDGSKIEVVDLPMPAALSFDGQRLPASYANFYIANRAVLVPTFNDPKDRVALGILAELINDRPIIGIHAGDLVWGLGTLH